jgi:VWFA-related protein
MNYCSTAGSENHLILPRPGFKLAALMGAALLACGVALGQQSALKQATATSGTKTASQYTIRRQTNLVPVRVVVRDKHGRSVAGLKQNQFQVFDQGQAQKLVFFQEVTSQGPAPSVTATTGVKQTQQAGPRFIAFYFDDLHARIADLQPMRKATERFLANSMLPDDMAALYTSSGKEMVEFTRDASRLRETLAKIKPAAEVSGASDPCMGLTDYQAFQIVEQNNLDMLNFAVSRQQSCEGAPAAINSAMLATTAARSILTAAVAESQNTISHLGQVVEHMKTLPGSREILLVSPGFFNMNLQKPLDTVVDLALREQVVINSINTLGAATDSLMGSASTISNPMQGNGVTGGFTVDSQRSTEFEHEDALSNLAYGTGGRLFHNSNDFYSGIQRLLTPPRHYYLMAFSPSLLQDNGKFHKLKIAVASTAGYKVEARRGYYAPAQGKQSSAPSLASSGTPAGAAAVAPSLAPARTQSPASTVDPLVAIAMDREELNQIPFHAFVQATKADANNLNLIFLLRADVHGLQFTKQNGMNQDDLKMLVFVNDAAGKRVEYVSHDIPLNVPDKDLPLLQKEGMDIKVDFKLAPGVYTIREVIQDAHGQTTALTRIINLKG